MTCRSPGRQFKTAWPTWWSPSSTKNTKISQAWWHVPIIPATQEAEAGDSLESRRQRLQWAEMALLHSSLGNRARLHLKEKKNCMHNHIIDAKELSFIYSILCNYGIHSDHIHKELLKRKYKLNWSGDIIHIYFTPIFVYRLLFRLIALNILLLILYSVST